MKRALPFLLAFALSCGAPASHAPLRPVTIAAPTTSAATAAPAPTTPDAPFRADEPAPGPPRPFAAPHPRVERLANGLRVLSVPIGGPMVSFRLTMRGASHFLPIERMGVFSLFMTLLSSGTPTHNSAVIRRIFEQSDAQWSVTQSYDAITFDATTPPRSAVAAIEVIADVVQNSTLTGAPIQLARVRRKAAADTARDTPSTQAWHELSRALYGPSHPYAKEIDLIEGDPRVDPPEVERVNHEICDPGEATLVIAGAVDDATLDSVRRLFSPWRAQSHRASSPIPPAITAPGPRLIVIDRPHTTQTQVAYGALAPLRSSADWPSMLLLHAVLGARPTSRITNELREKEKAAWSGGTQLHARRSAGLFYFAASVSNERVGAVLTSVDRQFRDVRENDVPATELARAVEIELGGEPSWYDTSASTVATMSSIPIFGLAPNEYETYDTAARAVDAATLRAAAARYLDPKRLRAVVVGDWSQMGSDLKALGWGPIAICDATGKVLRTE